MSVSDGARTAAGPPWVTMAVVVLISLVFWAEIAYPITPPTKPFQPSVETLTWLGALNRRLVLDAGQVYRLVTAPFMHASLTHIVGNSIALGFAGWLLERRVGHWWFAAVYVVGALAGDAGSMILNPPTSVSTGASGAIMGLFAAVVVLSFRAEDAAERVVLLSRAGGILVPALLPLHPSTGGQTVDYGAHLGGALGGLAIGLALLVHWTRERRLPDRRYAAAFVGLGLVCSAAALWTAITTRDAAAPIVEARAVELLLRRGADDDALRQAERLSRDWPRSREAWLALASAAFNALRMDEAVEAFAKAASLGQIRAQRAQGVALFYAGRPDDALDALRKYTFESSGDPYGLIWLEIVKQRGGEAPAAFTPTGSQDWPTPVLRLLAGEITPDALIEEARRISPPVGEDYVCEAVFYGGVWRLIHGDRNRAIDDFRVARRSCPPAFLELTAARAELRGLE